MRRFIRELRAIVREEIEWLWHPPVWWGWIFTVILYVPLAHIVFYIQLRERDYRQYTPRQLQSNRAVSRRYVEAVPFV